METIEMSRRERRRMGLMMRVSEGFLKLRVAAEMMRVSYRQVKRIWRRYRQEGDKGKKRQPVHSAPPVAMNQVASSTTPSSIARA